MADDKLVTHLVLDGVGGYMRGLSRAEYGLNAGAKAAENFRQRTARIAEAANAAGAAGTKMAMAGGAVVLGLGAMGKVAADFDKGMRNVNTIARLSEGEFAALRQSVLALATDPHIVDGPRQLTDSLYNVYSSGFSGALGLKVLEVAAKGGAAGMTDAETASRALITVMNAYNQKTGPDAAHIMDMLFKTVELGIPRFEEVANTIGVAINVAAQAGVPFEEVAAAFAVMTRKGIDAAMTSTSLARIMTTMLDPPKELAARIEDLTGTTGANILRTRGLAGAIGVLNEIAGENPEILAQMGIEMRALRAAWALSRESAAEYAQFTRQIADSSGAFSSAVEEQAKSQAHGWEQLKKTLEIVAVTFGDVAAGPMNEVATKLAEILGAVSKLPSWLKTTIVYLAGGTGLVVLFGGLALKLAATVVQTYLSITATRIYIATMRAEAAAAATAAEAHIALGAARAGAVAGVAGGAGIGLGVAVGAGVGIGAGILGLIESVRLAGSRKALGAATARREREGTRSAREAELRTALEGLQKHRAGLEWMHSKSAVAAMEWSIRQQLLMLRQAAAEEATLQDPALAAAEQRLDSLAKVAGAYEGLAQDAELVGAMEKAGAATAAQSYAARAALLENMLDQWRLMSEEERGTEEGRKLQMAAWGIAADQVNAKEKERKDLLDAQTKTIEDQTRAIENQLGLWDARVGYAQAYAEYLKETGRRGEARMVERNVIPAWQQRAAWQAFGVEQWYSARGMEMQALQAGTQKWRYIGEAAQGGRGGRGFGYQSRAQVDISKIDIPMERTFQKERSNETMLSVSAVN